MATFSFLLSGFVGSIVGGFIGAAAVVYTNSKQTKLTNKISKIKFAFDAKEMIHSYADESLKLSLSKDSSAEKHFREKLVYMYRKLGDMLDILSFALEEFDDEKLTDQFRKLIAHHYEQTLMRAAEKNFLTDEDLEYWKNAKKIYEQYTENKKREK